MRTPEENIKTIIADWIDALLRHVLIGCLASTEVDAQRAELFGAARLRRVAKDVLAPGDLETYEARGHDRGL